MEVNTQRFNDDDAVFQENILVGIYRSLLQYYNLVIYLIKITSIVYYTFNGRNSAFTTFE